MLLCYPILIVIAQHILSIAADKHVNRIRILQNHIARVTLRCKVRDKHVSAIYDELKWMTVRHCVTVRQRADYYFTILFTDMYMV